MNIFRVLLLLAFLMAVSTSLFALPPTCDGALAKKYYEKRKMIEDKVPGTNVSLLKFTDESRAFFGQNVDSMREALNILNNRYFELSGPIDSLIKSMMLRTHSYIFGPPGAAKSGVTKALLYIKQEQVDSSYQLDVWSNQFNELMSDVVIRGYLDVDKVNQLKKTGEQLSVEDVSNLGTIVWNKFARIDEFDKGNPLIFSALLDIINEGIAQYGSVVMNVMTETVMATSNKNLYELLEAFAALNAKPTAEALMDRFPFKVYMHNFPVQAQNMVAGILMGRARTQQSARNRLLDPQKSYETKMSLKDEYVSDLPFVDFAWLGDISAADYFSFDEQSVKVLNEIVTDMRKATTQKKLESEMMVRNMENDGMPGFTPTSIYSTRNILEKGGANLVAASLLFDLISLPEEILPKEALLKILEGGIPVGIHSMWRLQDVCLTTAPGKPYLSFNSEGDVDLKFTDELDKILESPSSVAEKKLLEDIKFERDLFSRIYNSKMKEYKETNKSVALLFNQLLESPAVKQAFANIQSTDGADIGSIEEFILLAKIKMGAIPASSSVR